MLLVYVVLAFVNFVGFLFTAGAVKLQERWDAESTRYDPAPPVEIAAAGFGILWPLGYLHFFARGVHAFGQWVRRRFEEELGKED